MKFQLECRPLAMKGRALPGASNVVPCPYRVAGVALANIMPLRSERRHVPPGESLCCLTPVVTSTLPRPGQTNRVWSPTKDSKEYGFIFVGDVSPSKLAQTKMAKSVFDASWS